MPKALALISGGLDSTLAAALVKEQGVAVHGLTFVSLFNAAKAPDGRSLASRFSARQIGIPLTIVGWSKQLLDLVKRPAFGHGANMNPCIDCRLAVLTMARERMEALGCDFVVTGEVLGERPMSQRRQPMDLVRKRSGLDGLLLRPLSAKLLDPTIPEERGWVDRDRLLDIRGRSRKPQMKLAERLGITEYPSPAGGCLLTDPAFSARMRDVFEHSPDADVNDAHLLKVGRHFRLSPQAKLVVGRNQRENQVIASYARRGDVLLEASDFVGPTSLLRGLASPQAVKLSARITAAYGKGRHEPRVGVRRREKGGECGWVEVAPAGEDILAEYRIPCEKGESLEAQRRRR